MAAASASASASAAASEVSSDGPVLSLMSKRLRALKKKYNRIIQTEESKAQGKPLNKEQEEVLNSKAAVVVLIEEYEKLRQPLSAALQEELSLSASSISSSSSSPPLPGKEQEQEQEGEPSERVGRQPEPGGPDASVEDLLNLLYFGCLFDVKQQSEFTSTMLTRTHERGCCLTYDYVTDEATDLLGERDLDLISTLGSLVLSRPAHASVSHKNALLSCLEHAKLWLCNSDQPIQQGSAITYSELRQRLNKILASDYFTTTPEFKAPDDVAAAVGKYATCQVQVTDSAAHSQAVQVEDPPAHNQQKDDDPQNIQREGTGLNQSTLTDEPQMDESHDLNPSGDTAAQQEQQKPQVDEEEQNQRDSESKEQQYIPRRTYQNQRGGIRGGGGRRGYANGRGGRAGRGGFGYQNGRSQYYDPGYYPRNNYNTRGRGGRAGGSGIYNNHGVEAAPNP